MQIVKLALCGREKSGKSTLVDYLLLVHKGTRINLRTDPKGESYTDKMRRLFFGTSRAVSQAIDQIREAKGSVFLEGVSRPADVKALQESGVKVVWLDRPEAIRLKAGARDYRKTHPLDDFTGFDAVVVNNGKLADLYFAINRVIRRFKEQQ